MIRLKEFFKKDILNFKLIIATQCLLDNYIDTDFVLMDYELKLPFLKVYGCKEICNGMNSMVVLDKNITVWNLIVTVFKAELLLLIAYLLTGITLSTFKEYVTVVIIVGVLLLKDIVVNIIENLKRYENI